MLVKFNADEDFVDRLKELTGETVASKAFLSSAARYDRSVGLIADLKAQIAKLTDERNVLRQVIGDARCAAIALVERASQDDMFIN